MKYILFFYFLLGPILPLHAKWYAGDFCTYDAVRPQDHLPLRFQEALDNGLDWRILYNAPEMGSFVGLPAFIAEEKYNDSRQFVPILGSGWQNEGIVFVGVDPRAPVPRTTPDALITWAAAHGGLITFTDPDHPVFSPRHLPSIPVAFQGLNATGWHPICEPGARWDSLLTAKRRVTLVGGSASGGPRHPVSYIRSESRHPQHLINGLRRGGVYVAEADDIHIDFRINDQLPGDYLLSETDMIITIRATARHLINRAYLVADGQIIWENQPQQARWTTRLRLPQNNHHYVRLVLESEAGAYRTMTNPIYLSHDLPPSIAPTVDPSSPHPIYLAIDSAIESMATLSEPAQTRILSEYLGDLQTRYATVLLLEQREDLIGDNVLEALQTSPNPAVRLGAAFAFVVRDDHDLMPRLFTLLEDPDLQVRIYAARMLYHFAPPIKNTLLIQSIEKAPAEVQNYLIRSLNPDAYDDALVKKLIYLSGSAPKAAATAAAAMLTEFGNRNFRAITTLRDSARTGHVQSVEILGTIADPRLSEDLHKLYQNAPGGPFKRASFQALQNLKAPYPERPESLCPQLHPPPIIDGAHTHAEWTTAAIIDRLTSDAYADTSLEKFKIWIGRDTTRLLVAITCTLPDSLLREAQIEMSISPSPALDIPFIISIPHPQTLSALPLDPLLDLAQIVGKDQWVLEGAITLSDLGVDLDVAIPYLRFNIALQTHLGRWAWTPTYGSPENPERFGNLYINTVASPPRPTTDGQ